MKPQRHEVLFTKLMEGFESDGVSDTSVMESDDSDIKLSFKPSITSAEFGLIHPGDMVTRSSSKGLQQACVAAVAELYEEKAKRTSDVAVVFPMRCRRYQLFMREH